jgi:hypothetical protein
MSTVLHGGGALGPWREGGGVASGEEHGDGEGTAGYWRRRWEERSGWPDHRRRPGDMTWADPVQCLAACPSQGIIQPPTAM